MNILRNPLNMRGWIEKCWLFSYRTSPERVRRILPPLFEPLTYGDFAFWNLLVCRVGAMRPCFFPAALGLSYWHVAYRVPVRFQSAIGEVQGLYFVRSDCDSPLISFCGNLLTDFNFHHARIQAGLNKEKKIEISSSDAPASIELGHDSPKTLEPGSPFPDLATADRFLKYKPAALAMLPNGQVQILRIGRNENDWKNRLIQVKKAEWGFLRGKDTVLEICQEVEPIDYLWKRGEILPS